MLHLISGRKSNTISQLQVNFHKEFELFSTKVNYANNDNNSIYNGEHCKIVSMIKKIEFVHIRPYNFKKWFTVSKYCHTRASLL